MNKPLSLGAVVGVIAVVVVLIVGVSYWRAQRKMTPTQTPAQQQQAEQYYREHVLPLKNR